LKPSLRYPQRGRQRFRRPGARDCCSGAILRRSMPRQPGCAMGALCS